MALSEAQQTRLRELKAQRINLIEGRGQAERVERLQRPISGTEFGIVPSKEQLRLQELKERRAQIISQSAIQNAPPEQLINQLVGIGPLDDTPRITTPATPTGVLGFQGAGIQAAQRDRNQQIAKRNIALKQLRSRFSDEQIQNAVEIQNLQKKASGLQPTDLIPTAIGTATGALAAMATAGPDPTDIMTVPAVSKFVTNLIRGGATGAGTAGGEILRQKVTGEPIDLKKAGRVGTVDALLDFTGGTVMDFVGSAIAPFRQSIIPEAQEFADDFAKVGKELGEEIPFRVTPAQLTASGTIDTLETIAESAPIGRGSVRSLKKILQPEQFKKYTDFKLDEISEGAARLDATDLSPIIDDALRGPKGTLTLAKIQSRRNYAALDELVGDAVIDLGPLKKFAKTKLSEADKIGGRSLTPSGRAALQEIVLSDDKITYQLASQLRSSFIGELPALKFVKDRNVALIQTLAKKTDQLIASPGTKFGISENADALRRIANKFHAQNFGTGISGSKIGTFNTNAVKKTLKAISQEEPEKLIPIFFKKNARKTVELGRQTLGDETFNRLRSTWLDNIVRQASTADGVVKGNVFLHNINTLGPETLNAIFPNPAHLKKVVEIGTGAQILQAATGGAGQLATQQAQFGAIAAIASGATRSPRATITAVGILGAPKLMAAIINSPKASNLLVQGMRLPAGSKEASSFLVRAIRASKQRDIGPITEQIRQLQTK